MLSVSSRRILHRLGTRSCMHDASCEEISLESKPLDIPKLSSNRPRVELDPQISRLLEKDRRVGSGRIPCIVPPEAVSSTLLKCISKEHIGKSSRILDNVEKYIGTGQKIQRSLKSRKLPMDSRNRIVTKNKFRSQILRKVQNEIQLLSEEDDMDGLRELEERIQNEVDTKMESTKGNWSSIHFDYTGTWSYILGGPSALDYAAAVHTLRKVFEDNKAFKPLSHLDFGSGVGTFSWALRHPFRAATDLKEEFFIDVSSDMHDASRLLRSDAMESTPNSAIHEKGVFYRLHFPANETLKYDLVTVGSSLSELESSELRLSTVDSLWRRVQENGYLVVYELGTNAGFQVLSEIRDYLLQIQSFAEEDPSIEGELIAPCPHSMACPRYLKDVIPCNFDIKYKNFQLPAFPNEYKELIYRDRISYAVFRKGKRRTTTTEKKNFHRIVKEKKKTKSTFICELCTNQGTIEEIFTHKRDKLLYKYTKQVEVGDIFKANLIHDKTTSKKE